MAYLHHRLSRCPHENWLLEKARQTGRRVGRPAAHTAPHKVMPLQVALRPVHSHTASSPRQCELSMHTPVVLQIMPGT